MPCHDGRENTVAWDTARRNGELRARNDKLARIACNLAQQLERRVGGAIDRNTVGISHETASWWQEHKAADAAREAREAAERHKKARRKAIFQKLTPQERKEIGVEI